MRTPANKECRYFYGNYHRGRRQEECRLLSSNYSSHGWRSSVCFTCPVPEILQANSCQHMILEGNIKAQFIFFKPKMSIHAHCTKTQRTVQKPHIGCGECVPLPSFIVGENIDIDPPA